MDSVQLIPISNIPLIQPHDDLAAILVEVMQAAGQQLQDGDLLLLAQKIVSKAEDCFVRLSEVTPSARALELAAETGKDAREIEVILWDTADVIRTRPGLLIVEHRHGYICANAGLDRSNVSQDGGETVLRLPADPDASAVAIRKRIAELTGRRPPVLIIDSHNRPWRIGVMGTTIGLSGLKPVLNLSGLPDLFGRLLLHTEVNVADQLASAASLIMGQADEACPAVIARGVAYEPDETATARQILRPVERDLFR